MADTSKQLSNKLTRPESQFKKTLIETKNFLCANPCIASVFEFFRDYGFNTAAGTVFILRGPNMHPHKKMNDIPSSLRNITLGIHTGLVKIILDIFHESLSPTFGDVRKKVDVFLAFVKDHPTHFLFKDHFDTLQNNKQWPEQEMQNQFFLPIKCDDTKSDDIVYLRSSTFWSIVFALGETPQPMDLTNDQLEMLAEKARCIPKVICSSADIKVDDLHVMTHERLFDLAEKHSVDPNVLAQDTNKWKLQQFFLFFPMHLTQREVMCHNMIYLDMLGGKFNLFHLMRDIARKDKVFGVQLCVPERITDFHLPGNPWCMSKHFFSGKPVLRHPHYPLTGYDKMGLQKHAKYWISEPAGMREEIMNCFVLGCLNKLPQDIQVSIHNGLHPRCSLTVTECWAWYDRVNIQV